MWVSRSSYSFAYARTVNIAVSLLRPVIGSNDEIDFVALNWVADVRKQIAAAFKWLYKYFASGSTVFIKNSTFTVIIKLLHHLETTVQLVCLYNTSIFTWKSLIFFLIKNSDQTFSINAAFRMKINIRSLTNWNFDQAWVD